MNKIVLGDRMLVDKRLIPEKAVVDRYLIQLFDEKTCVKCDNLENRLATGPNELCVECPAFIANYKLFREAAGGRAWSLPQGDFLSLSNILEKKGRPFELVEKRPRHRMAQRITFTGTLFGANYVDADGIPRANQIKLAKTWWKHKTGIIKARPRSGKTVVSAALVCRLGVRTVIIANRFKLLKQFYRTFMGDETHAAMSDIPDIQANTGREVIRIAEKSRDLKNLDDVDILIVNYQKLVRDPAAFADLIRINNYSLLVVDEVHGAGAEGYLRVAAAASVRYRLGLSATTRRKDNRHKLVHRVMGPTVAESESVSLVPNIHFYESAVYPPKGYTMWQHAVSWLARSKPRNIEIVKQVFRDLRAGHRVIILPVDQLQHQATLVAMINHQARVCNEKRGEDWPEELAVSFNSKSNQDAVINRVDDPSQTVLVGIRSMIKEGLDMARPSKIYIIIPMSASNDKATGAPMFEQLSARVCTPAPKPQPEVLIWLDNVGMFRSCINGLCWNELWPKRFLGGDKGMYRLEPNAMEFFKTIKKKDIKPGANVPAVGNSGGWV